MIIHVAGEGETINSIARLYGLSAERLALENGIGPAVNLAVGETIVILFPEIVYTVQNGDTLSGIASAHNISIMELLRNNPYLVERRYIYPGETVVIKYEDAKIGQISTNGYVYPFVNLEILRMTLPFLTFLSIYGHAYTSTGGYYRHQRFGDYPYIQRIWRGSHYGSYRLCHRPYGRNCTASRFAD